VRVLLVSRELQGFLGGGIGTYAAEMARTLAVRGHEVHLLTAPHEHLRQRGPQLVPGVRIHTVDLTVGRAGLEAYPTFPMRYSMAVLDAVERLTREAALDYIEFPDYHGEGYFTTRAKRTLGLFERTVLAVRLHSTSALCRQADADARLDSELAMIEHLEREACLAADLVIAPGQQVLRRLPKPTHPQHRNVIPVPLDIDHLVRDFGGIKSAYSAPATPVILFFGKLQYLKGPQDLVEAGQTLLRRGVQAHFRLIGNDSPTGPFGRSMLEHLQRRIEPRFADAFRFEPARPRRELGPTIRDADICCFPSRWEAFPLVCLEALALGAPVVASDAGGLSEIVQHGESGLLFPAGDAEALANCLERMLADPALRQRLGTAGPVRVRELCDPSGVIKELEHAITACGTPDPRPPAAAAARPLVSIIIPFYNLGEYLPATLASARQQTYRNIEILVVDDGSTDPASLALLDQLPANIRIIRKPNGGLGSARNAGLREARGQWIVPLDADDLFAPTLIEECLAAAAHDPGLAYISPLVAYFTSEPGDGDGGWIPLGLEPDLLPVMNIGGAASGSLILREAALAVDGWDEWMTAYEDWEFWCRLADAGRRGSILPEFLLHYRVRPNSMFRTELSRHQALHAYILQRHPRLITERTARILAAMSAGATPGDPRAEAQRIIAENIRYRLADRVNDALKKAGVQKVIKGVTTRVIPAD
jgi:glycosyltransferase involved in cell wall biosynthesis/GT2 family glycosyltransferase